MNASFPKFIFSAFTVLPLSISAAEIILDSSANFNGNENGNFSIYESQADDGTTYLFKGNISIQNIPGKGTAIIKSCFTNTKGDLIFIGNGNSLAFNTVNAGNVPGAAISSIVVDKTTTFSGFSLLSFISTPGDVVNNGQGAFSITNSLGFDKNNSLLFSKNFSTEDGGAIKTKTLLLKGTTISALFSKNQSLKKGGAIHAPEVITITGNEGEISFSENTSKDSGAAIFTESSVIISDNAKVSFIGNKVTGTSSSTIGSMSGGAICAYKANTDTQVTLSGNRTLVFSNNMSTTAGGAIHVKKLELATGGLTLFNGNTVNGGTTPKGGAVAIESSGELSLSADLGDIVFLGNTVTSTNPVTNRNSIDLGTNAKLTVLRAASGQSIYFYDPITVTGTTVLTDVLKINEPPTSSPFKYIGNIIFTGEQLSESELLDTKNLTSQLLQPVTLVAGTLSLKQGAILQTQAFTQEPDSRLEMDMGTSLEAFDTSTIDNLILNISSIDGSKQAKIETKGATKNLTLSGAITLWDASGNFYENHSLRNSQAYTILDLKASGTVTHTGVAPEPVMAEKFHYGYQGTWGQISWSVGSPSTATFNWTKTGYIPNPERVGSLVPNSLWNAFIDISSLHHLVETATDGMQGSRVVWAAGLSNFFHKDSTKTQRGFRHLSGGYVLGGHFQTCSDKIFSGAFCQLFGRDRDYLVTKNQGTVYGGTLYYQHNETYISLSSNQESCLFSYLPKELPLLFSGSLSYTHTDNDLKTKYTAYPTVMGDWGNDSFAIELSGRAPISLNNNALFEQYMPFIKLQFIYAHQESFKEQGSEARQFGSSSLTNLALPIGIRVDKESDTQEATYNLTIGYIIDLIRSNPNCTTTLLISGDSWETLGTNLARQALVLRAGNHYSFNSDFEAFSQFSFELRGSSRNYNIDFGAKYRF
ncbi:Uncharacterized protein with a C-terminal OMP (outer membrane protein) domain,chlamydial polymorphic outer membrane protein repeat,Autotransporter beta-domain [Chlamydia serpentis]|uniref:Uncharacterized protein with a C-terminal OMP (Outer membrane protein) domain,chlamydial polymorphic outer membrane protein repeat,Autotransporter beta-domain n=1 Tax=Chlamydia serpentis TaxID=1967782 RepID=A0A2R8F9T9_9CHLA|nr:autotransporter domain-containing protein [Chlamydia serpentis]SPN73198.1 Uncharacterized protein with a C-terminal OMP (outer membrane protein) domain,chlamydial polymorphic outer membrane protein repeat,Autotransporter beta-domain [Chlamydia serpentis]